MAIQIRPSGIRAVFDRALELEREGRTIVHLEIGRPHFDSPEVAKRAAIEALEAGSVHYTANRGIPELREAIAERAGRDPAEVIVTLGGSEAVAAALIGLVEPGQEVLILDPAWPHYDACTRLARGVPVHVPCDPAEGFQPDPERVAAAITPRTRLLIVSSPSNPSGAVFERERIAALAELCVEHDLLAISDEIYAEFVYDGAVHRSLAAEPGMCGRTLILDSCSKTWSMTGWRVGWAIAPPELGNELNLVHQFLTVCASSFAQAGAAAAIRHGAGHTKRMVAEYADRRAMLIDRVARIPALTLPEPGGAFYAFPAVAGESPAGRLLEEAGVAVVPGDVFGEAFGGHVRISYAVSAEELEEGLDRLESALA